MIPLFFSGSIDLSRSQSLTEMFLDVCFEALVANREPFFERRNPDSHRLEAPNHHVDHVFDCGAAFQI
jgi:hypothetical protein